MSRELTTEEVRSAFVSHCSHMVDYWARLPDKDVRERLSGLVFSILVAIDGGTMALPRFILAPSPHPDDKAFHQERGEDWWPENHEVEEKIRDDISGSLHELFCQVDKR